jgi:hypothetical protein
VLGWVQDTTWLCILLVSEILKHRWLEPLPVSDYLSTCWYGLMSNHVYLEHYSWLFCPAADYRSELLLFNPFKFVFFTATSYECARFCLKFEVLDFSVWCYDIVWNHISYLGVTIVISDTLFCCHCLVVQNNKSRCNIWFLKHICSYCNVVSGSW